ncbi:hypothetical protein GCM10023336_70290 [Streptomyces similanensis]|uniref:Uncharacterized protein n=1 Tax=Streptomyces similanensis TaxID=1274988 RepID=A0ABP9LIE4_9ACTN
MASRPDLLGKAEGPEGLTPVLCSPVSLWQEPHKRPLSAPAGGGASLRWEDIRAQACGIDRGRPDG